MHGVSVGTARAYQVLTRGAEELVRGRCVNRGTHGITLAKSARKGTFGSVA